MVEYENKNGKARWNAPPKTQWDYTAFGRAGSVAEPDGTFQLKFEKIPGGRGGYNRWTINGKSWPETNPLFTVQPGQAIPAGHGITTAAMSTQCTCIATHSKLSKLVTKQTSGLLKDTISMPRHSTAEIQFVANDPGPDLLPLPPPRSHG